MGRSDTSGALKENQTGFKSAVIFGLLATGSIAMTAWAAGASEPPEETKVAVDASAAESTNNEEASNDEALAEQRADLAETALRQLDESVNAKSSDDDSSASDDAAPHLSAAVDDLRPPELSPLPDDWSEAGLDPAAARETDNGKLVQTLDNGLRVTLTIDPAVQSHMEAVLQEYGVPHGSVVLVEPDSGRVLAMVDESNESPQMGELARQATAPSASVFKIVTAAALLEGEQLSPRATTCYSGGRSFLSEATITGGGSKCDDLSSALANSINAIMAKRTYQHLDQKELTSWAKRFGFNTEIPFELPVESSSANIPDDKIERARTAAGFWHTYLSPLHGAMIGAAIQNDGLMMKPSIIEKVETPTGRVLTEFEPEVFRRVVSSTTANQLSTMLAGTTTDGTADDYFAHRAAFPTDVETAGKTGTLADDNPYLSYTWFVGYGQHQKVEGRSAAVGGLICNDPKWRIKGPWAASEALRKYFQVRELRAEHSESDAGEQRAMAQNNENSQAQTN